MLLFLLGGEIVDREGRQPRAAPSSFFGGHNYPAFSINAS
jgi:hypothetical protein